MLGQAGEKETDQVRFANEIRRVKRVSRLVLELKTIDIRQVFPGNFDQHMRREDQLEFPVFAVARLRKRLGEGKR